MRKALLILILTLFVTPALAGCLGGGDEVDTGTEEDCPPDICGSETTEVGLGGVKGQVVDETLSPVVEANVTIRELDVKTKTDASGKFTFNNLEPGTYTVFAQKQWFQANGKQVTVEADTIGEANIQLVAIPPPAEPYEQTLEFVGFFSCAVSYGDVTAKDHCGETTNDPNAKSKFDFAMDSGLTGLVVCFDADNPQYGTPPELLIEFHNPPTLGGNEYRIEGPAPYCEEPFTFDEEDTWREDALPTPEDAPAAFQVRLSNPPRDSGKVNYAYQMSFQVYMGVFYNGEPIPDGYDPRPDA